MHLNTYTSTVLKIKTTRLFMKMIIYFSSKSGQQGNTQWGKFNYHIWYAVIEVRETET